MTGSSGSRTALLAATWEAITSVVEGVEAPDRIPTGAAGWSVQDLLLHVLLDAQRALVACATPGPEPADVDAVGYWAARARSDGSGDDGGADSAHARFVRRAAAAYDGPAGLLAQWRATSGAAVRALASCPHDRVRTQGHVLTVADLVETLVVEAAVHHLDLVAHLPSAPPPSEEALRVVRSTLDGLLGTRLPTGWDAVEHVLKGTGRLPLDDADRAALGPLADRFPLLG